MASGKPGAVQCPRSAFDADLLFSLGAFMTVCRIQRNQAEERVKALLEGGAKPASGAGNGKGSAAGSQPAQADRTDTTAMPDLEQISQDLIRLRIAQKFKGHALTTLVSAVLEAQGYRLRQSPEGADGGVDIIAGSGPLGFDPPRIAVQVKSQDGPMDIKVLRELQGVMDGFKADHGLLVAWGGYTQPVVREASRLFFKVRLWDAADVVRAVQDHYDRLPEALQAELPLKRVWTIVPDDE